MCSLKHYSFFKGYSNSFRRYLLDWLCLFYKVLPVTVAAINQNKTCVFFNFLGFIWFYPTLPSSIPNRNSVNRYYNNYNATSSSIALACALAINAYWDYSRLYRSMALHYSSRMNWNLLFQLALCSIEFPRYLLLCPTGC